jgi:CBS domain-containing protein
MRCEEVMKKEVVTIAPDKSVRTAAQLMRDGKVGFIPVIDAKGQVLGAITDRDIVLRGVAEDKANGTTIRELMSEGSISCSPEDDIGVAHREMARRHVSRLMCIDSSGRLQGVLSLSDLAKFDYREQASETLKEITTRQSI